ncbi:MAG: transglycosylase SLT domain-containing protein [Ruminococcus sp.]
MQLMPETAASLGVSNPYDPYQNIMGGAKFISQLVEQFKGYSNGLGTCRSLDIMPGPYAVIKIWLSSTAIFQKPRPMSKKSVRACRDSR